MKIKQLLMKTFLMAVCLLGETNFAWADNVSFSKGNTIGATDNSTTWYGQASEIIAVGPHQRLTLKFKTYTATDDQLTAAGVSYAWNDQMTHALNIWDGQQQNFYMKGNGWGWKAHSGETNDPADYDVNTNGVYNGKTYGWAADYRTMIGTGADVVMYIERNGSEMSISQTFTTSGGVKYNHYFSGTFGLANSDVWLQMTVENAHIDITADKELTDADAVTGTLIGKLNRTGRLADHGAKVDFTLAPEKSLNLKFKSYNNHIATWGTWLVELQHETDYYDVVSGTKGGSWGSLKEAETVNTTGYPATDAAILDALDGATVDLTVSRSGATVNISATITPISGDEMTLTSSITPTKEGFATSDITVRPLVELGYIDLLPVSVTIGATGWTTFASAYPLNLSTLTASEGTATAYYASAASGSSVTMTSTASSGVAAGQGLALKGTPDATVTIPIAASGTAIDGNKLVGCTTSTPLGVNANYYVLVNNSGTAEFQRLDTNGATIPAGKAYLDLTGVTLAPTLSIVFENETTGISEIKTMRNAENEIFFDLQGRKVAQPTKGLYIVNGRKVIK